MNRLAARGIAAVSFEQLSVSRSCPRAAPKRPSRGAPRSASCHGDRGSGVVLDGAHGRIRSFRPFSPTQRRRSGRRLSRLHFMPCAAGIGHRRREGGGPGQPRGITCNFCHSERGRCFAQAALIRGTRPIRISCAAVEDSESGARTGRPTVRSWRRVNSAPATGTRARAQGSGSRERIHREGVEGRRGGEAVPGLPHASRTGEGVAHCQEDSRQDLGPHVHRPYRRDASTPSRRSQQPSRTGSSS
jgi:hypothetical protein